jgi:hypothetical protein
MCQISANPMKVAKKAQMKPVGLFLGSNASTFAAEKFVTQ